MKNFKFIGFLLILSLNLFGSSNLAETSDAEEQKWLCEGYCFLGGDVPTNPFQPVSATGATEQEARDNIDCGAYQETGISCKKIEGN